MEKAAQAPDGRSTAWRTVLRFALASAAVVVVAIPFAYVINAFPVTSTVPEMNFRLVSRLSALLALSFLFLDVATGSFRPLLARVVPVKRLFSIHSYFGLLATGFVTAHLILLLPVFEEYETARNMGFMALAAVAFLLLLTTVLSALDVRKFSRAWRRMHLLNYVIFAIVILHALFIGSDRVLLSFKVLLLTYAGVALAGLVYRAVTMKGWRSIFSSRKKAEEGAR